MRSRGVLLSSVLMAGAIGACATTSKPTITRRAAPVAPAQPRRLESVHPARFVLLEGVGVSYDETGEPSPIHARDPAIVSGKRLLLEGGRIIDSAAFPEPLRGFRSLPARLGGGYVFWSDDQSYHAPTFLGKLTPFVSIGARGGVRTWFDSFVLRTEMGPLEITPTTFAVRRTELARFSEMISLDGKLGIRIDPVGRMEASVDGGKTFRPLTFDDGKKYIGPSPGPSNTLLFRRDSSSEWSSSRSGRQPPEDRVLGVSGTLIPFDPKTMDPLVLDPPTYSAPPEEPAFTRRFAPPELGMAAVAGALVPGEQIVFLRESTLRVLSAKTGEFIQDLPLSLGSQEFGHCQPMTLGEDAFLACTHATGAHLYALRGTPTTVQLEATFPEPGGFVAGLGRRFLFMGRCGSTPPTVRDFPGYGSSDETPDAGEPDPNAPPPPPGPPEPPPLPEDLPEKPTNEATVCVRLDDGTWVDRRIEGLKNRTKSVFLPGDDGQVTVVLFDKPSLDTRGSGSPSALSGPDADPNESAPKASEGVRFIRVDARATKFSASNFFTPYEPNEPRLRTVARDVWLDEKDGSVHGWELQLPKEDESSEDTEEPPEREAPSMAGGGTGGRIVGVQIKSDGSVTRHELPEDVESVVVGGPYALARAKADDGPAYYESTDGGRTFVPVAGPVPGDFIENPGGEIEGCSIIGCSLGGGVVRLGWGGDAPAAAKPADSGPDKPADPDALTSKVFDPSTLVPAKEGKSLRCRLEAKESSGANVDKPFAVTTLTQDETHIGDAVDRKWAALAGTPFKLEPAHQVLFEDVNVDALRGEGIAVLRATATNPVGLFLRAKDFRFDMSPGAKRKPVLLSAEVRGAIAAELDRDTFVLLDVRLGEVQLVRGSMVRSILRITQIPDVNYASLTLARRLGTGDDVLAVAIVQPATGDILLGDLDLGRGSIGPLRVAGNLRKLSTGAACVRGARDHRLIVNEHMSVQVEPGDDGRAGLFGASLISLGSGNGCLEASEMRLVNAATLVVRYAGADSGSHPAMLHDRGTSLRANCTLE